VWRDLCLLTHPRPARYFRD